MFAPFTANLFKEPIPMTIPRQQLTHETCSPLPDLRGEPVKITLRHNQSIAWIPSPCCGHVIGYKITTHTRRTI